MRMPVVFFDLETTGLDPKKHDIIQIAAIATNGAPEFKELERFEVKVLPGREAKELMLEAIAKGKHPVDYSDEKWSKAISIGPALLQFQALLNRYSSIPRRSKRGSVYKVAQLAAHNAEFDMKFLMNKARAQDVFMPATYRAWDTIQLVVTAGALWGQMPDTFGLGDLCDAYGIKLDNAHDALADVEATVEVARYAMGCIEDIIKGG